jgi:hypothetical protein
MKKIMLVLLAMVILSGCAISLSPEFATKARKDLSMSPIIYYRADWIHGVYGYPSFVEALASKTQITRGALVVDDEKIAFVRYDKGIQKYDYIFQLKYPDVTDVRVFKKGLTRRLVLKTANSFYTLEIVKGGVIDRRKTYEFAIFIADKSGKDSSDFSKELAKEKEKDPSSGGEPTVRVEQKEPESANTAPEKPITSAPTTFSSGTTKILTWDFSVVKSAPGNNYSSIATVRKGDKLTIMEQSGEWVKVRLQNGQEGWVRSEVLE